MDDPQVTDTGPRISGPARQIRTVQASGVLDRVTDPAPGIPVLDAADTCTFCGEHASVHIRRGEVLAPTVFHRDELAPPAPVGAVA